MRTGTTALLLCLASCFHLLRCLPTGLANGEAVAAVPGGGHESVASGAAPPTPAAEAAKPGGPPGDYRLRGNFLARTPAAKGAIEDLRHAGAPGPVAEESQKTDTQKTTMRRGMPMRDADTQKTEVKASLSEAISAAHTPAESFGNSMLLDVGKEAKHGSARGTVKEEAGDEDAQKTEAGVLIIRPLQPLPATVAHQVWVFSRFYIFLIIAAALAISLWQNAFALLCKGFEQLTGLDSVRPELGPV